MLYKYFVFAETVYSNCKIKAMRCYFCLNCVFIRLLDIYLSGLWQRHSESWADVTYLMMAHMCKNLVSAGISRNRQRQKVMTAQQIRDYDTVLVYWCFNVTWLQGSHSCFRANPDKWRTRWACAVRSRSRSVKVSYDLGDHWSSCVTSPPAASPGECNAH